MTANATNQPKAESSTMLLTTIPFAGFYETKFAGIVDYWEGREADYRAESESESGDSWQPAALRLDASDFADSFYWSVSYSAAYEAIAKDYAAAFGDWIDETAGFPVGLQFESMTSPREYNFSTDRIFCHIPAESAARLRDMLGEKLATKARERFTSRDGFASFYPAKIADWPDSLEDWDWNHIGTIIEAYAETEGFDDWGLFYPIADSDYEYCESACNWETFESCVAEKRAEKLTALIDSDMAAAIQLLATYEPARALLPDCIIDSEQAAEIEAGIEAGIGQYVESHYRCPYTLELPFTEESARG